MSRRLRFEIAGEAVAAPGVADRLVGAGAVALGEQRARQRELALGGMRRIGLEEGEHGRRVAALLPQHRLRPPAQA